MLSHWIILLTLEFIYHNFTRWREIIKVQGNEIIPNHIKHGIRKQRMEFRFSDSKLCLLLIKTLISLTMTT